jgi:hypothetical protein
MKRTSLALAAALLLASATPSLAQPVPDAPPETPASPPASPAAANTAPPTSAVAALDRAAAAYDYGDMNQVVDATRPIVDGALTATPTQRGHALRLLGIGLYLTGRPAGAETHFLELLRLQPRTRLDPTTTRPEVVAFFEDIRRRHPELQPHHSPLWNLLPPLGQFKNGDRTRGYIFLTLEATSLATAITTVAILKAWRNPGPGDVYEPHTAAARTLKTVNQVSVGVLAASYAVGVIDAFLRADRDAEPESTLSFFILPTAAGLTARF